MQCKEAGYFSNKHIQLYLEITVTKFKTELIWKLRKFVDHKGQIA